MPEYRRNRVAGGCYFFTVTLRDRRSGMLVAEIGALREAVRAERARRPFEVDAWVVLPEHMRGSGRCRSGMRIFRGGCRG